MKYYAIIDTNVLVSALLSSHADAATVQVVSKLFSGEVVPVYSKLILDEYNEVLHRKKFKLPSELIDGLLTAIIKQGEYINPSPSGEILVDMKDLPFYEVVLEKQADNAYLVTGNMKHFPVKPFIVTANEFLKIIAGTTVSN